MVDSRAKDYTNFVAINDTLDWLQDFKSCFKYQAGGYFTFGDTPNRVISKIRLTTRKIKMVPDPNYPGMKRWITNTFDPLKDKAYSHWEDTSDLSFTVLN